MIFVIENKLMMINLNGIDVPTQSVGHAIEDSL